MKLSHNLILVFVLSFFAFSAKSEEYRAPKFKWNKSKSIPDVKVVQEKDFKEFGENSYRVEESPESQRNVASEDEENEGRGPSSTPEPEVPTAQPWPYK